MAQIFIKNKFSNKQTIQESVHKSFSTSIYKNGCENTEDVNKKSSYISTQLDGIMMETQM
uniref:Uncharacterized protein n=1 Tax=Arion vulgaris TaxID=1028688 RepID=A0A0B7BCA1_9EUPU